MVGSNVSHRLSSPSPAAQLLYIDPNLVRANTARLNMNQMTALDLSASQMDSIKTALDLNTVQDGPDFGKSIADLMWPEGAANAPFLPIDPCISQTLAKIEAAENLNIRLSDVIGSSGLSASRFRPPFAHF